MRPLFRRTLRKIGIIEAQTLTKSYKSVIIMIQGVPAGNTHPLQQRHGEPSVNSRRLTSFLEKEEMSMNNADRAAAGEAMCKFARAVQVGFVL